MKYNFRNCTLDDFEFLFELKKQNFKWYVDKIWGWKDDEQKERVEASGSKVKTLTKEEKDEELKKIKKESDFVTECEVKASDFDVRHDDVRNVDYICDKSLSILVKANRYKVSLKMYNGCR